MVPDERRRLLAELDELMEESRALRQVLDSTESAYATVRAHVEEGSDVRAALLSEPVDQQRQRLSSQLERFERARHRVRRRFVLLGQKEGVSLTELARLWGLSRQLVARYAREPNGDSF